MRIGTDTSQRALVGTLHSRQSDLADLQHAVLAAVVAEIHALADEPLGTQVVEAV